MQGLQPFGVVPQFLLCPSALGDVAGKNSDLRYLSLRIEYRINHIVIPHSFALVFEADRLTRLNYLTNVCFSTFAHV